MSLQKFSARSKFLAGAAVVLLGLAGWGVARASQKFFTPGVHIEMKMADPAEGFIDPPERIASLGKPVALHLDCDEIHFHLEFDQRVPEIAPRP